jgi:hypothetical protein
MNSESWAQNRLVSWIGHYSDWLTIMNLMLISTVIVFPETSLSTEATLLSLAITAVCVVTGCVHDSHLCERCIRETPLDASAQAARYHRRLRLFHSISSLKLWIVIFAVAIMLYPVIQYFDLPKQPVPLLIFGFTAVSVLSIITHRRLQPWCPYCPRGQQVLGAIPVQEP